MSLLDPYALEVLGFAASSPVFLGYVVMLDPPGGHGSTGSAFQMLSLVALLGATQFAASPASPPSDASAPIASSDPCTAKAPYRDNTGYFPVDLSALLAHASPAGAALLADLHITRWQHDLGVVEVISDRPVAYRSHGAGEALCIEPGVLVVDVRDGRTMVVRIASDSTDLVLSVSQASLQGWEVRAAAPAAIDALDDWQPAPPECVDEVTAAMLGAQQAGQTPWMAEAIERLLVQPTPTDAAMAFGLVARLAPPTAGASIDALAAAPPTWRAGVDWLATQQPATIARIERDLLRRAATITDDLDRIVDDLAVEAPREQLEAVAVAWLHRRDDLESAALLLDRLGRGEKVRAALAQVDAAVRAHGTALSEIGPLSDDERLAAVAWQEPDAWWGLFALAGLEPADADEAPGPEVSA